MLFLPFVAALVLAVPQQHQVALQELESLAERGSSNTEPMARKLFDEANAAGDVETNVRARLHLLRFYRLRGAWEEIVVLGDETVALAESAGLEQLAANVKILRAGALTQLERQPEAQTDALEALAIGEKLADASIQARARLTLSSIAGRSADFEMARRHIDAGLQHVNDDPETKVRLLLNQSLVSQALGDIEGSQSAVDQATKITLPKPIAELEQTLLLAQLSVLNDQPQQAQALAARVAEEARAAGNEFLATFADVARARRACMTGDDKTALALFDSALEFHERADNAQEMARVLDHKASCLQAQSRLEEALISLRSAHDQERRAFERQRSETIASLNAVRRERELESRVHDQEQRVRELETTATVGQRNLLFWTLMAFVAVALAALAAIRARSNETRAIALQSLQSARSDMLAVAGHEIRNPIQGLMGALTALLHDEKDDKRRQLMATAHRAVQTIARISNDAFDLSLMDRGQFALHRRPSRLIDILTAARDWVAPSAAAKGATIFLSHPDEELDAVADVDAERLGQVVLNLLTNALRYGSNGEIRIESSIQNQRWFVSVLDNGPGVRESELPRLFDAYFRGANAGEESGGGLGLSVAKRIIAAHGGEISARNRTEGGAAFSFSLPLANADRNEAVAPVSALRPLEGLRLLIIDDDELVRLAIRVNAEIAGAVVLDLEDGTRLEKSIREFDPDVVLSDKQLEHENGIELLGRVREMFKGIRPRLALMTGSVREQQTHAPIDLLLIKPFSGEVLVDALAKLRPLQTA